MTVSFMAQQSVGSICADTMLCNERHFEAEEDVCVVVVSETDTGHWDSLQTCCAEVFFAPRGTTMHVLLSGERHSPILRGKFESSKAVPVASPRH